MKLRKYGVKEKLFSKMIQLFGEKMLVKLGLTDRNIVIEILIMVGKLIT